MMTHTQDDYAILSLTLRLPRQQETVAPPLDLREYNQLATVLWDTLKTTPGALYHETTRQAAEEHLPGIRAERTGALIEGRRHELALLRDEMESMGITVVTARCHNSCHLRACRTYPA
jgi:hypothetical protein